MKTKKKYIAPSVERFLYQAEEGFALSQLIINPWEWSDNDQDNRFDENGDAEGGTDWKWDD